MTRLHRGSPTHSCRFHLVVVGRTSDGDLVLDNPTKKILPWSKRAYRRVRIQTPENPNYWASLGDRSV
ncbi:MULTISPECIES: transglutaminase-like cysteine peptidase [unclassified Bradyrhizobium]